MPIYAPSTAGSAQAKHPQAAPVQGRGKKGPLVGRCFSSRGELCPVALSEAAGSSERQGHSPDQPQPLLCRLSVRAKGQPAAPAPSLCFFVTIVTR